MVKVFGIGLAKTGSISLQKAWDILNYRTLHYPVAWSEIDNHDAVNGTSVACRFEEVDRRYPGSKFILTIRDIDSWLQSCYFHYCERFRQEDLKPRHRTFRQKCMLKLYRTDIYDFHLFTEAYFQHLERVKNHFDRRHEELLIFDVSQGDGWEKLCYFLDVSIPNVPFPHSNQTSQPITIRDEIIIRVDRVTEKWMDE